MNTTIGTKMQNQPKAKLLNSPLADSFSKDVNSTLTRMNKIIATRTSFPNMDVIKKLTVGSLLVRSTLSIAARINMLAVNKAMMMRVTTKVKAMAYLSANCLIILIVTFHTPQNEFGDIDCADMPPQQTSSADKQRSRPIILNSSTIRIIVK
jgi:hypothetical protein